MNTLLIGQASMTIREAILKSLDDLRGLSSSREIYKHIINNNYYSSNGKTFENTVNARLGDFIKDGDPGVRRIKSSSGFLYYLTKYEQALDFENIEQHPQTPINKTEKKERNKYPVKDTIENDSFTDDEGVENEDEELQPFDPEKISLDSKKFTMDGILRRFEQETIKLDPDFQRKEVWTDEKKSRLMESIMLKIPIPMFYVSADEKGVFSVVDGLQRLSTIRDFVLGKKFLATKFPKYKGDGLRLNKLEFWGNQYNNCNFNQLPTYLQNRILETEFTFTIINPGTPEDVKRNVFKRINTGGDPLTAMEIRHALYTGTSTDLLHILSEKDEFKNATGRSVKTNRMMDRELILRFLSFMIRDYHHYYRNNNMDAFLSDTMRIINIMPELNGREGMKLFKDEDEKKQVMIRDIATLEYAFILAMKRCPAIFGLHAFRKSYGEKRRTQINKSLFEVWSVLLGKLSEDEFIKLEKHKSDFLRQYYLMLEDNNFTFRISQDSWKYSGVQYRYSELTNLINKFIND